MRWLRTLILFDKGDIVSGSDWLHVHDAYRKAIESIENPVGSGSLTLRRKRQYRRENGEVGYERNGVHFLRNAFRSHLENVEGWKAEGIVDLSRDRVQPPISLYPNPSQEGYREPITSDFGGFDIVTTAPAGATVALEWETGNISSSHRSLNKLAIALQAGIIEIGVLIVPSRELYVHLTDRIGNISELSGYLAMWESLKTNVSRGVLAVSVVEHDALTDDLQVKFLRVGQDGRAKQGQARGPEAGRATTEADLKPPRKKRGVAVVLEAATQAAPKKQPR